MEAALCEANTLACPFGENGATPDALWRQRERVTEEERRRFDETLTAKTAEMEREHASATEGDDNSTTKAKRQREAISRALLAEGHLNYTTSRIPSAASRRKVT